MLSRIDPHQMTQPQYDKIFVNAKIYIPGAGFNTSSALAEKDGKIAAISSSLNKAGALEVIDVDGQILTAGLIDIHTHIYHKANLACVDPLVAAVCSGATTLVDAGTTGASSIEGLVDYIIKPCPVRLLAFLNISYAGIYGFHPYINVGEAEDARLLHKGLCIDAANRFREHIVGIKVRIGKGESGDNGDLALDLAIDVAESLNLPVMAHIGFPPMDLDSLLDRLRPRDILTHCFRGSPNAPLSEHDGGPRESVIRARQRGVLFDIGHGRGSFSLDSASAMVSSGFLPDTISSDIHQFNVDGPVRDLLHVASKILALNVPLDKVIDMMTCNAAAALRRPELGKIAVGAIADLTILALEEQNEIFEDCSGVEFSGRSVISVRGAYSAGKKIC